MNESQKPTLKIARVKAGWTQLQLAEVLGITSVTISNLERGVTRPMRMTRRRIETICGPIDWHGTEMDGLIRGGRRYAESANGIHEHQTKHTEL